MGLFDDIEEAPPSREEIAAIRRMRVWADDLKAGFAAAPHRPAVDGCSATFGTKRKWLLENQPDLAQELIAAMAAAYERVRDIPIPPLCPK